ncbi:unnamed protein product [Protopolystoma xenopodis]|uniref:Uncharacterized protein n=1 Tax=Protopolystoma xenopodis TaxID=117903 RepID=A0A3S5FG28_9PLAT|nr:unnamed protein product [Protopolystoma xenopodis]
MMAILTDDADYDAGETFRNVPRPWFNFGNGHADNGPRTSCPGSKLLLSDVFIGSPSLLSQLSLTLLSSSRPIIKFL